jgi:outer membrane protein assembly factor BamB
VAYCINADSGAILWQKDYFVSTGTFTGYQGGFVLGLSEAGAGEIAAVGKTSTESFFLVLSANGDVESSCAYQIPNSGR